MKTKLSIAIFVLIALVSCNTNKQNDKEEEHTENVLPGVVVLNKAQREALNLTLGGFQMRNLTTVVKVNGNLEVPPAGRADVTVAIGGNVKEILVFTGDKVKKGRLLAVLEHPDYISLQEDFAVVASQMEFLEKNYERQKELYENNVGSGKQYQQAKAEYNKFKAKYEGLKTRLLLLNISPEKVIEGNISATVNVYSPINGFVNEIDVKIGSYVDARDKLFEIADNSAIHADFMVYEKDIHLVKKGQKVHFTVSNRPGTELTATVFAIGKEFDPVSRTVHIHAKIDEPVYGLIPGMFISGHLHTDETYTRTLPNDAVVKEGTKYYIFIQDNDALQQIHAGNPYDDEDLSAFKMTEVITGKKDDGYTEIRLLNPLPENTQIVMNAAYYLLADLKKEEAGEE